MRVLFLLILIMSGSCKFQLHVSDKKFITSVHDFQGEREILIRKVHYPQWQIYYVVTNCDAQEITAAEIKKQQAAIVTALQIWLQPLQRLTDHKLIGSHPDDFVFLPYEGKVGEHRRFHELPWITGTPDGHELEVVINCQNKWLGREGWIVAPLIDNKKEARARLQNLLGRAFGLLDTSKIYDHLSSGTQPASIMAQVFTYNEKGLPRLAQDDRKAIQWLYRFFHRRRLKPHITPVGLTDCPYLGYRYVENEWGEGSCRPHNLLLYLLKQAHLYEKNHRNLQASFGTLKQVNVSNKEDKIYSYNLNAQDEEGNTGLHYAVLFGAWSLWTEHNPNNTIHCSSCVGDGYNIISRWHKSLQEILQKTIKPCLPLETENVCLATNQTNNNGNTALHYAAQTGYVAAVELLLARPKINPRLKNIWGKTACELAQEPIANLKQLELGSIKTSYEDLNVKIQAIQAARQKIIALLTQKNAC